MNDYQLTPRSKWLYKKAKNITEQLGTPFVSIEHLLTAFFFCEESKSIRILSEMGFDYESFRMWLVEDYFSFDDKSKNKFSKSSNVIVPSFLGSFSRSIKCVAYP